jgi:hypothetical protein
MSASIQREQIEAVLPANDDESRRPSSVRGYRYLVIRTAFHHGGVVSEHRTLAGASRSMLRFAAIGECTCGCAGVWDRAYGEPPTLTGDEHYSSLGV